MQVDQCQGIGLLITNGEFVSLLQPEPTEVVVAETNTGVVQFSNCAFWGPAERIARIGGTGSVSFSQCHFMHWDSSGRGLHAIECLGGDLNVSACRFSRPSPGVRLGPDVRTAVVTGNHFAGRQQVTNESAGDVQVGLNVSSFRPLEIEAGGVGVDDLDGPPGFRTEGQWTRVADPGYQAASAVWALKGEGEATATWTADLPRAGRYEVWVFCGPDPNRDHATDAEYTVTHAGGERTFRVDQTQEPTEWRKLGVFGFGADAPAVVRLTNRADGNVVADAVKFVPKR